MGIEIDFRPEMVDIRFNHPPSNIFDFDLMRELSRVLDQTAGAPLVVLSSSIDHFSLGVDVKIHTPELSPAMLKSFHEIVRKLYNHPGITVSLLNGYALGGGMELALVSDFAFARKDTILGFPEIRLACFPPVASILLPRKIGGRACTYLYTGKLIDATVAEDIGIIEGVFAENAEEFLDTIRQHSLPAMSLLKKVLRRTSGFDFNSELLKSEEIYITELVKNPDMSEGVSAFLQKRRPDYTTH